MHICLLLHPLHFNEPTKLNKRQQQQQQLKTTHSIFQSLREEATAHTIVIRRKIINFKIKNEMRKHDVVTKITTKQKKNKIIIMIKKRIKINKQGSHSQLSMLI